VVQALPRTAEAQAIGNQLLRSGTSVGANSRAACRAKSTADHINKLKIVEEEADESLYWLELLVEAEIMPHALLAELMKEGDEILAIIVTSIKTQRTNK
jgi:four helix bundle protein